MTTRAATNRITTGATVHPKGEEKKTGCFNCGKDGHRASHCPALKNCDICNKPGHLTKDCKQKGRVQQFLTRIEDAETKLAGSANPAIFVVQTCGDEDTPTDREVTKLNAKELCAQFEEKLVHLALDEGATDNEFEGTMLRLRTARASLNAALAIKARRSSRLSHRQRKRNTARRNELLQAPPLPASTDRTVDTLATSFGPTRQIMIAKALVIRPGGQAQECAIALDTCCARNIFSPEYGLAGETNTTLEATTFGNKTVPLGPSAAMTLQRQDGSSFNLKGNNAIDPSHLPVGTVALLCFQTLLDLKVSLDWHLWYEGDDIP